MGVALEAEAYKKFGAVVANQADGILGGIFSNSTGSTINQNVNPIPADRLARHGDWNVTPYSGAQVQSGLEPKLKFLFRVEFKFYEGAARMASSMGLDVGSSLSRDLTYVVKQIDLPKYTFDYEEINYYNFRTKVLKKINHDTLNFTFYDDVANNALKFMSIYLQILQPLSRTTWTEGANLEGNGFAFAQQLGGLDSGMRGAIRFPNTKDVLSSLTVHQYYLDRHQNHLQGTQIRQAIYMNSFVFTNPRIASFNLHDQDHEQGQQPNMLDVSFDYDALRIKTGIIADTKDKDLAGLGAFDILTGSNASGGTFLNGPTTPAGGGNNFLSPFTNIVANQGARAVQSTINDKIRKSGLGSVAGGELSIATSKVAGALGTGARRTLQNIGNGIASGITAPKKPPVTDNAVGGATESQSGDADE